MGISQRLVVELCKDPCGGAGTHRSSRFNGRKHGSELRTATDGDFRREEKAMADAIGKWMQQFGECIYGCDYAGWEKQAWGYYTRKEKEVYMVVFTPITPSIWWLKRRRTPKS